MAYKNTIHLGQREGEDDPRYLHIPEGKIEEAVERLADAMEEIFHDLNGGDQERPICGGCVAGLIGDALPVEIFRRSRASLGNAAGFSGAVRDAYAKKARHALGLSIINGEDTTLFDEEGEPTDLRETQDNESFMKRLREMMEEETAA